MFSDKASNLCFQEVVDVSLAFKEVIMGAGNAMSASEPQWDHMEWLVSYFQPIGCCVLFHRVHVLYTITRSWFQMLFIFTPIWGNDPIWRAYFQMGWNHQPDKHQPSVGQYTHTWMVWSLDGWGACDWCGFGGCLCENLGRQAGMVMFPRVNDTKNMKNAIDSGCSHDG